jgi:hypothetical protein
MISQERADEILDMLDALRDELAAVGLVSASNKVMDLGEQLVYDFEELANSSINPFN